MDNRIVILENNSRYDFVSGSHLTLRDEFVNILAQLFRVPVNGKPITILGSLRSPLGSSERRGLGLLSPRFRFRLVERDPDPDYENL